MSKDKEKISKSYKDGYKDGKDGKKQAVHTSWIDSMVGWYDQKSEKAYEKGYKNGKEKR